MKLFSDYFKSLCFWIVFLVIYFIYKYIEWAPLMAICSINESNFQHYKAAFFSWIIISVVEYPMVKGRISDSSSFFYSRMATATILPWFIFILWYIGPAVYGRMPNITLEIAYANVITILAGISGVIFEKGLSGIKYFRELKILIIFLFLVSLMHYIIFTFFKMPWADVFTEPVWRMPISQPY
jgi:hypothetical protein